MTLRAAFAEADITPGPGIAKAGWLQHRVGNRILDPLFARVLVLEANGVRLGFVSLDLLSIRWTQVQELRAIARQHGIVEPNLLVAATHNHAGPAVVSLGSARRDDGYIALLRRQVGEAIQQAVAGLEPAQIAIESGIEARVSFIRRAIMKDGSAQCHPPCSNEVRCLESVIDPEVGVLCVKDLAGRMLGAVVNFACHPTHHGGDDCISAGWPGQLSVALKRALGEHCVALPLNGAFGDVFHHDALNPDYVDTMEKIGQTLADDVTKMIPRMRFRDSAALSSTTTTLKLPLRDLEGSYGANARHRQRFASDEIYEAMIARLRAKKARRDHALAELQCLRIGDDAAFVAVPAELFASLGLRIKLGSPFSKTYVVGAANGMVGYIPPRAAFERGGYETTLAMSSKLDPVAADLVTEGAIELLQRAATPIRPREEGETSARSERVVA